MYIGELNMKDAIVEYNTFTSINDSIEGSLSELLKLAVAYDSSLKIIWCSLLHMVSAAQLSRGDGQSQPRDVTRRYGASVSGVHLLFVL